MLNSNELVKVKHSLDTTRGAASPNSKEMGDKISFDKSLPNGLNMGVDGVTLFSTTFFNIALNRENQIVPGMLRITPTLTALNRWEQWESKHWIELLQVQRLCELTLIKVLDNRDPGLNPLQDTKVINLYGRQRRREETPFIEFEVVPRYARPVEFEGIVFQDPCFGVLFDFTQILRPTDAVFNRLLSLLRAAVSSIELSAWELGNHDTFTKTWDDCISCKPAAQHPTGVVEAAGFRMALDREIQDERGKAICDTAANGHVPALRYWQDNWMVNFGKIFGVWRSTVNALYPSNGLVRDFDLMCLMNSARPPRHTYWRFIPRTEGGRRYGYDIWTPSTPNYVDIKRAAELDKTTVEEMVRRFGTCMTENLHKIGIEVEWPTQVLQSATLTPAYNMNTVVEAQKRRNDTAVSVNRN